MRGDETGCCASLMGETVRQEATAGNPPSAKIQRPCPMYEMAVSCAEQLRNTGADVPQRLRRSRVSGGGPGWRGSELTLVLLSGFATLYVYRTSRMHVARCPAISNIGTMRAWSQAIRWGEATLWPSSTVAATRPNTERRDPSEFPFSHLVLAIRDENHPRGSWDTLNGRQKVPVPGEMGNSQKDGHWLW